MHNHEMHVQRLLAFLCHGLYHRESEGDVRNEHTVHDVEMQPVGLAGIDHLNVGFEVKEICRKKGRRNQWFHEFIVVSL